MMRKKKHTSRRNQSARDRRLRRLAIRAIRREPPDSDKLGRALIEIAQAEEAKKEQEAQAQHEAEQAEEQDKARTEKDGRKEGGGP